MSTTIQTAFKFDSNLTVSMKNRAMALGLSLNRYVRNLIEKDIADSKMLPKVSIDDIYDTDIERLSGILKKPNPDKIKDDPRAEAIWER